MDPSNRMITLLSHWLARHVGNEELRSELGLVGTAGLGADEADAVVELLGELERPNATRGELEMVARETLEALALG